MNISNDSSLHQELINNGLLDVVRKYVDLFSACAKTENKLGEDETVEGIDLDVMPVKALELLKCIIVIAMNLSNSPQV